MTNTIEAGVFVILLILAFIPFLPGRIRLVAILSMVIFAGLGLAMASQYDVVVTKNVDGYTQNELQRNGTGQIVANTTIIVPSQQEQTPVINAFHIPLAYTFFGLALFSFYLFIKELFDL
jgi:hypothetical protein